MQLNYAIVGTGVSALSSIKFLQPIAKILAIFDTRDHPPGLTRLQDEYPGLPIYCGLAHLDKLLSYQIIVLSPGVVPSLDIWQLCQARGIEITNDIGLAVSATSAPLIAITGSNGKSTVTEWVGHICRSVGLKAGVGGNLGTPALDLLQDTPELLVLELSSAQLEHAGVLRAKVATVLNVSPDHLDRYPSFEAYKAAKLNIYQQAETVVVNRQDPQPTPLDAQIISFGLDEPPPGQFGLLDVQGIPWLAQGSEPIIACHELSLRGKHNWANALATLGLCEPLNLPRAAKLEALRNFEGLQHRCQWVTEREGVTWINDSKATNPGATLAALAGLKDTIPGRWLLIAGGVSKGADLSVLKAGIGDTCRAVLLIGQAQDELYQLLHLEVECIKCSSMGEAVTRAKQLAQAGDGVLLSPACASFDMFANFEARGTAFMAAIGQLPD